MTTTVVTTQTSGTVWSPPSGMAMYALALTIVAESNSATVELRQTADGSGPASVVLRAAAGTSNRWVTADSDRQWPMARVHFTISGSGDPRVLLEYENRPT